MCTLFMLVRRLWTLVCPQDIKVPIPQPSFRDEQQAASVLLLRNLTIEYVLRGLDRVLRKNEGP